MKKSKLLAALAAGMMLSTGAMASAESNLGASAIGASQTGMFRDGDGISAPMALAVTAIVFAVISEELTDYTAPAPDAGPGPDLPPMHGMQPAFPPRH